jgi:hypothetical protein
MTDSLPCPACSAETDLEDMCMHSRDPLCWNCCGAGEHVPWAGGVPT